MPSDGSEHGSPACAVGSTLEHGSAVYRPLAMVLSGTVNVGIRPSCQIHTPDCRGEALHRPRGI